MIRKTLAVLFLAAGLASAPASGQVKDPQSVAAVPGNGLSMEQVIASFGEPREKVPAVGDPPITRWSYEGYTVYFEYQTVLHSVVHR